MMVESGRINSCYTGDYNRLCQRRDRIEILTTSKSVASEGNHQKPRRGEIECLEVWLEQMMTA
jgi:hypothetical protein